LPSVDYYYSKLPEIEDNLQTRIQSAKGEEKIKLQEKLDRVRPTFYNYKNLMSTWISDYESGNFKNIKLDPSTLHFNKTTWF